MHNCVFVIHTSISTTYVSVTGPRLFLSDIKVTGLECNIVAKVTGIESYFRVI